MIKSLVELAGRILCFRTFSPKNDECALLYTFHQSYLFNLSPENIRLDSELCYHNSLAKVLEQNLSFAF